MADEPVQPLIPAQPWYTSQTQVAGVIAGLSQIASILIRMFHLGITDTQVQEIAADSLQLVTLIVAMYAMIKRQTSAIAPLTLTRARADAQTAANPPLHDTDPTKVKKDTPT